MFYNEVGFRSAEEAPRQSKLPGNKTHHTPYSLWAKDVHSSWITYMFYVSIQGDWSGTRWITFKSLKYLDSIPE